MINLWQTKLSSELTDKNENSDKITEKKEKDTPNKKIPLSPSTKTDLQKDGIDGSKIPTSKCDKGDVPILDNLTVAIDRKDSPQKELNSVGQSVQMKSTEKSHNVSTPVGKDVKVLTVSSVRAVDAQSFDAPANNGESIRYWAKPIEAVAA